MKKQEKIKKLNSVASIANEVNNVWNVNEDELTVYNSVNNHSGNDITLQLIGESFQITFTGHRGDMISKDDAEAYSDENLAGTLNYWYHPYIDKSMVADYANKIMQHLNTKNSGYLYLCIDSRNQITLHYEQTAIGGYTGMSVIKEYNEPFDSEYTYNFEEMIVKVNDDIEDYILDSKIPYNLSDIKKP